VALAERGVPPYRPQTKEGIALLAGAPGTLALAIARHRSIRILARQLLVAAACAIDALRAPLLPYDPAVADLAADPLMANVLTRLGRLLAGSDPDRPVLQAPVSYRVVPQVLTHLERTLARVEEDIRRGLKAVGDSPAFVAGAFISTGAFHAIDLATDMDVLCMALAQAGELAGQHIHRLLDHRFSGLPDQLTPLPGPHAGLIAVHKRVVGAVNELRRLAAPATVGLADTSLGQEDAMTFAYEAADKLRRAEQLSREIIACALLTARQSWTLRPAPPADGLQPYVTALADAIPPVDRDRPLGGDIETLIALLRTGAFS
jgi:histidine ammonia-lyase